jgi:hypothetical protein
MAMAMPMILFPPARSLPVMLLMTMTAMMPVRLYIPVQRKSVIVLMIGQSAWYADADNDGFGNPAVSQLACFQPSGYVSNDDDCNDANAAVHPGATEVCNSIDDDCDGLTDDADPGITGQSTWYADTDNDGFGNPAVSQLACFQPSGYVSNDDDCNDANAAVHPGATEVCNNIDDDCDGLTDDADPGITGQATWYADADNDGFGNAAASTTACFQLSGYVSNDADCNDANDLIHPGATENLCNNVDDNCNNTIDEGRVNGCTDNSACNFITLLQPAMTAPVRIPPRYGMRMMTRIALAMLTILPQPASSHQAT